MKKISRITKIVISIMAMVMMLSMTFTSHAVLLVTGMTQTEDGRVEVDPNYCAITLGTDDVGMWTDFCFGYPYRYYREERKVERPGISYVTYDLYLDCYLTDYIKTHDASEWPDFVIKGSDGVPFYYAEDVPGGKNYDNHNGHYDYYYVKYCYDEASGWWLYDKAYKGPYVDGWGTGRYVETVAKEDLIKETKADIESGKTVNGTAQDPMPPAFKDRLTDTEHPEEPEKPEKPEITDPYADVNTLGATVTLSTDCIKVKKNNAAQKPMPKSVKIGKTALKKNKTFTVSYEKYENGWNAVDAVTDEGIYRLVVTGQNGYDGVYKKRLYVTADKTVKAMSSVSVKVNKMSYAGEPVTSGVIKSVKAGGRTLTEGTDYTVTYTNNIEIGTAQVTLTAVEGKGILGTKTVNFRITENKLSKAKVKGLSPVTYDPNKDMVQDMSKVTLTYGTKTLKADTDFTVAYTNNTKAGTAKITFTGKGIYSGKITKSFKITKAPLSENMLDNTSKNMKLVYTGKALKPEVTLKNGNTVLVKGTDYTLAYSNNTKISTDAKPAQITIKGKGSYTGSFKVPFMITSDIGNEKTNAVNSKLAEEETAAETETASDEETTFDEETLVDEGTSVDEEITTEEETSSETETVTEAETVMETETVSVTEEETVTETETVTEDKTATEDKITAEEETAGGEAMTEEAFSEESAADDTNEEESAASAELTEEVNGAVDNPTELTEEVDSIDVSDTCQEQGTGETGEESRSYADGIDK